MSTVKAIQAPLIVLSWTALGLFVVEELALKVYMTDIVVFIS